MQTHISKYSHGQTVYLKHDPDQHARMVTGISFRPGRAAYYELSFGTITSWHYEVEISEDMDVVKKTSN